MTLFSTATPYPVMNPWGLVAGFHEMMNVLSPIPTAFRLSTLEQSVSEDKEEEEEEDEEDDKHKEWHVLRSLFCAVSKEQVVRGVLPFMSRAVRGEL